MSTLATLAQLKGHLHIDWADQDADLQLKLDQAEDAILGYLKAASDKWTAESVPPRVNAAILMLAQALFDGGDLSELIAGLGKSGGDNPIVALLYRDRDPALS